MPQAELRIAADHPSFAGHFPGRPIVPGVVLLDTAQRLIESAHAVSLTGIAVAKFHSPASPGEALVLDYALADGAVRFEIRSGGRKIADGRFTAVAKSPSGVEPSAQSKKPSAQHEEPSAQ